MRRTALALATTTLSVALASWSASAAEQTAAAPPIRGYPVVLAAGDEGGVWYGGATNQAIEYVERVDYITPAGAFRDFEFPSQLAAHYPRYFAPGANGDEWFLADENEAPTPILGEVSPLGMISAEALAVNPKSDIRGLAIGADGDLWTTATRLQGHTRISSILKITPTGALSEFSRGLLRGSDPANITAGPDGAMWFTDTAGRIGRIDAGGAIHEFPIGRPIVFGRPPFEPSRPIVAGPGGDLWFIAGPDTIGRVSTSGDVRFFTPHSSYRGSEALGEKGELVDLAAGPDGDLWFTRESGEVARMDGSGQVRTVTNRLLQAYGIAFGMGGIAWVGEGPRYTTENDKEEGIPARLASIAASGYVRQYPARRRCPVPDLIGMDRAFATDALEDYRPFSEELDNESCEGRVVLGHITVRRRHRRGPLIVVSQAPRAGTLTEGYLRVNLELAPVPEVPSSCRAPAFYPVLVRKPRLVVWSVTTGEHSESTATYYGCIPPHGRIRAISRLGEESTGGSSVRKLISAGPFVGFTVSGGDQYGGSKDLDVYDVATGRSLLNVIVEEYSISSSISWAAELARLGKPIGLGAQTFVLNANGDVAWLGQTEASPTQAREFVLYLHDRHGTRRVTVGPQITGLAFMGSLLTWQAAGATQSVKVAR
jgi:streptogramin lyase